MIGREKFYPNRKHVVLRVCSPLAEDGLQFSEVFVANARFGNTTAEAPPDGYTKELVLPYEWFEQKKDGVVFVRLGGLYGKMIVFGEEVMILDPDAIDPVERPILSVNLLYNPDGSRNLRTTYPD